MRPGSVMHKLSRISSLVARWWRSFELASGLAFRGGTALFKLHLSPAARYSDDIDFVQVVAEPIGKTVDAMRAVLDPRPFCVSAAICANRATRSRVVFSKRTLRQNYASAAGSEHWYLSWFARLTSVGSDVINRMIPATISSMMTSVISADRPGR